MKDFDKQMEMVLYHSDEGDVSVDAYIMNDSLWITQKAMAELFGVQVPAISCFVVISRRVFISLRSALSKQPLAV